MADTLAGIDLDDVVWLDRLTVPRVRQNLRRTLGGGVVVVPRPLPAGWPITLECYLTEAQLKALGGHRDAGAVLALSIQGETHTVVFEASQNPIETEPLAGYFSDPDDGDLHLCTLRLMTV